MYTYILFFDCLLLLFCNEDTELAETEVLPYTDVISSSKTVCLWCCLAMWHFPVCLEVGPPSIPENEVNAKSKASECFAKCPVRIACKEFNYSRYIYTFTCIFCMFHLVG